MADQMTDIDRVQKLLGLTLDDADKGRVEVYIVDAKQAIMTYIAQYLPEGTDLPSELNYLVDQLTLAKYNKFHNEGMNSVSEEGLSMSFNANDLKDYLPDLQAWIDRKMAANADDSMSGNAIGW
ncbi:phage head-tail connector protein [Limosilactobacillus pontis]|uniref:Phage head-tail connector protein n=1 Tax=Limosilactobacillus pontis TaxID=35787 RepID=A0ABU7SV55_9LACO